MDTLREINNRPIQECHHHEAIQSLEQRPKVKHQLDDNYWIHEVWNKVGIFTSEVRLNI